MSFCAHTQTLMLFFHSFLIFHSPERPRLPWCHSWRLPAEHVKGLQQHEAIVQPPPPLLSALRLLLDRWRMQKVLGAKRSADNRFLTRRTSQLWGLVFVLTFIMSMHHITKPPPPNSELSESSDEHRWSLLAISWIFFFSAYVKSEL